MLGITSSGINVKNIRLATELKNNNIPIIDCSITNLIGKNWEDISEFDIHNLSEEYEKNSIRFNSLQSIFYGKNLDFNNLHHHEQIIKHIRIICKYGKILNCKKVLFGSPKQRRDIKEYKNFINIFKAIDEIMIDNDFIFNIENLERCDGILLKTPNEILSFIKQHNLKSCKLNLHLFIEEQNIKNDLLKEEILDTIHLSNYQYTDSILIEQYPLLKNILKKIQCSSNIKIIEFNSNNTPEMLKKMSNI